MPNNLIVKNKVKQILQWYTEGVPKLVISQRAGVSRNIVKSYIRQFIAMDRSVEELLSLKDADLEKLFLSRQFKEPDRQYLEPAACFPDIDKALKKKCNTLYRLWQEYLKEHPDGFKHTQFNKYYRQWSARTNSTLARIRSIFSLMYLRSTNARAQRPGPDYLAGQAGALIIFNFSFLISLAPAWTGNLMSGLAFAHPL